VLFFEGTSYTVSESAGSLEVCLFQDLEIGASVAAGLQVEVNLAEASDTSLGKSFIWAVQGTYVV